MKFYTVHQYILAACVLLAGQSSIGVANPAQQPPSVIVVHSSQGLSFGTKVLLGLATFGGVLYLDARYTGGHIIYNRLRNRLFSNIDKRLADLEEATKKQQTLLTELQGQVQTNGQSIATVQKTANRVETTTTHHTRILNNHTDQLSSLTDHVSDIETGVRNNGKAIELAHTDIRGVRSVVDAHSDQLNGMQAMGRSVEEHTTQLNNLEIGQQQLLEGQTAIQRTLEKIEQTSAASADSGRQTLQLLQRTASLAPTIRTIAQHGNIHSFSSGTN